MKILDIATTPTTKTSLFSQPRSQSKGEFEKELAALIAGQPEYTGQGTELVEKLTTAIANAQRKQALGFLPDNARWRLLRSLVQNNHRFMLAMVWGNCTPDYLATAPEEEIQHRISIMNSQSQDDFIAQLRRSADTPDPSVCSTLLFYLPLSSPPPPLPLLFRTGFD